MFESLIEGANEAVVRLQFGARARIEFYETLSLLLENHVLLHDALKEMVVIASEENKKPNNPRAIVIHDCLMLISEGQPLSQALAKWTNDQEASLIAAGEKSGRMTKAFEDAIKVITAKRSILSAALGATVYPAVLFALACGLLHMVANQLVPKLAKVTDPKSWEGAAKLLYRMAQFVTGYGVVALICLLVLALLVFATLPYLRGRVRVVLDQSPPWSVYRTLQGSTFLLNVAVMLQSGVRLEEALQLLAVNAKPWLKERIDAALYGIRIGGNLGVALHRAGHHFPDKKTVQYLSVLANHDGFEAAMSGFGDRWLAHSIKKIQTFSKVTLACGVLAIGALMVVVIAGAGGIQNAVEAGCRGRHPEILSLYNTGEARMNQRRSSAIEALRAELLKRIKAGVEYIRLLQKECAVADRPLKFGFVFIVFVLLVIIILSLF